MKRENEKIRRLVMSAVFCALIYAATWISIPLPTVGGNLNLGDCVIFLASWRMGGAWAILSSGAGASLCDLSSAYAVYAPGTFLIKAGCAAIAWATLKWIGGKRPVVGKILGGICGAVWIAVGYYLYEAVFLSFGFAAPLVNLPFNLLQGGIGIALALLLDKVLPNS